MTSTVCCGRTYIARNKIDYPQMLPDMVNEKINRFLRKSALTLIYANKGTASLYLLHRQYNPSASYSRNFKPLTIFCGCTARLVFDLVGNHRNSVSCDVAQISNDFKASFMCAICTGCKFAPGCIFGHVNGVLRICTRVQICSFLRGGANLLAPGCTRVQIVHMNANCIISIHFDWRFR